MISRLAVRLASTVSAATLLCTLASCATHPTELTTNTVGLPLCDAHNTPNTRFLVTIRLRQKVDDIFDRDTGSGRNVTYTVLPESPESVRDGHAVSTYPDVNANPYDSDLSLLNGIKRGDIVEYRVVLDNNTTEDANYAFYGERNALGNGDDIRGMAVIPRSRSKFICSRLNLGETDPSSHKTQDVAHFYITYRHDPDTPTYDSFSVFLVPKAGATTTVVIIDPKIMNSG